MGKELADAGAPQAFESIVYGGLAIGILDFLDASIFFPLYYGIGFLDVWHGPAAGLIGREASRNGGVATALLGVGLHFLVAFSVAAAYFLAARYLVRVKHFVIVGLLYGVAVNLVMQHIVIPLSAIGPRTTVEPLGAVLNSFIGHAFLVGLPVATIAAWSARKASRERELQA
ncbi:MAG: hypothetical protein AB7F88_06800 [Pyrinomonadaceae bacterium]